MLTLLFWNTHKKKLIKPLRDLVSEHNVDILLIAEAGASGQELASGIGDGYSVRGDFPSRIEIISRLPSDAITDLYNDPLEHITIREVRLSGSPTFLLVAVHLSSKLHKSDEEQALSVTELHREIVAKETQRGHQRSLVIGDFNMNPFESGLVGAMALHSTFCKSVASRGSRKVSGRDYPFLYNPMWKLMGNEEQESVPGTYFRSSGRVVEYFWNTFDQVLLRPDLLPAFLNVSIIRSAGDHSLLNIRGEPDATQFSDHLPILCKMNLE